MSTMIQACTHPAAWLRLLRANAVLMQTTCCIVLQARIGPSTFMLESAKLPLLAHGLAACGYVVPSRDDPVDVWASAPGTA